MSGDSRKVVHSPSRTPQQKILPVISTYEETAPSLQAETRLTRSASQQRKVSRTSALNNLILMTDRRSQLQAHFPSHTNVSLVKSVSKIPALFQSS